MCVYTCVCKSIQYWNDSVHPQTENQLRTHLKHCPKCFTRSKYTKSSWKHLLTPVVVGLLAPASAHVQLKTKGALSHLTDRVGSFSSYSFPYPPPHISSSIILTEGNFLWSVNLLLLYSWKTNMLVYIQLCIPVRKDHLLSSSTRVTPTAADLCFRMSCAHFIFLSLISNAFEKTSKPWILSFLCFSSAPIAFECLQFRCFLFKDV